jgi:phosphoenolpyruvate synthase/pyruvate phosphate dikinase
MNPEYILSLADTRATLAVAGGKGASLARLSAAGLPVPAGFHVTTAAYGRFVVENALQPDILAALKTADAARPATLEAASRAIQDLFARAHMPQDVAQAIAEAYAGLPGEAPAVAVRSSATAEDLPGLSFAGQQETFLNIRGIAAVQAAVQRCWASLWTARAIGYRLQHGIDQDAISLAVVVQALVLAEAAGILFTANPVTGQREQAMLTAAWGLGEAIVGGLVTPDTLVVDKATGRVLARETGDKQVMTVRVEGGTQEQPVPETLRQAPVLDDQAAAELVRLGVQIEQLYAMPMDIEWTWAAGQFAIVQARPVTALPEPEAPVPTEWKLPDPADHYIRGSIIELMPGPLSPLFSTLGGAIIDANTRRLFAEISGVDAYPEGMFATVNDYAYMKVKPTLRLIVTTALAMPRLLRTGEQRWREDARPRYEAAVERWQAKSLSSLTASEILAGVREIFDAALYLYTILQSGVLGSAMSSEAMFTRVYDKLIKRAGDPPAVTYLLGFDSAPILAEKSLYDLAEWCRARADLAAFVSNTPARQLAAQVESGEVPAAVDAESWGEWQRRIRAHLQKHGHALYDLDFAKPTPADDPAPLLDMIKLFITGQVQNPYARQQALADRREQATQTMLTSLKWLRLKLFRKLVTPAQKWAPLREDAIADVGLGYPLLRRMARELGRRCAQAGAIEQADDIFWLYQSEAEQMAAALDKHGPIERLAEHIRQRKATARAEMRVTPPPGLPIGKKILGLDIEKVGPARVSGQAGDTIQGAGTSPGQVTACARVLRSPEDFDQMKPGEILVAAITTPAWTPLFAMASAVVTDIGGPLSHGSIVAREYGIPAVLGTGVATKRIRSGQLISVDGSAGVVTLAKDKG